MDEPTDAITKDGGHQSLECRGCVAVTHPHYVAPECAKYCSKCHLMDVFWYDAYLFIWFGHLELWAICCPGHIITNDILVREWSQSLTVLSFCSCKLKTVCSLPLFFGMQSIGTTLCATVLDAYHWWIFDKVRPTPPSSAIPSIPKVRSYLCHISDTSPFVPVPLVSPFIPMFPVSLISISMPLWSSHLSHKFSPPRSCLPLFHTSTFCS